MTPLVMKNAVIVVVALLVGLLLGNWSVRTDLRRTQQELASLRQELNRRPAAGGGHLSGISSMLKIPEQTQGESADRKSKHPKAKAEPVAATQDVPEPAGTVTGTVSLGTGGMIVSAGNTEPPGGNGRGDFRKKLETGMAAWKARSDLARTGFIANVAETEAQTIQFDVTMAAMNLRLSNSVRTWVDSVRQTREVGSESGIRIMNDLSSALVQAYNDLDRTMPADWRSKAGADFEVVNFINPDALMPLADVDDIFRKSHDASNPEHTPHPGSP